jgi:protein-tyrosine phosphatase
MADLNIFGVAQPTISGISSVLTLLKCHPTSTDYKEPTFWFSAREEPMIYINRRPFVLRDGDNPLKNIRRYQGINSARLEQMETRLKEDILKEVIKCNGLLLVHDEIDNNVVPFWTAVDSVMTTLEVFQDLKEQGYKVEYVRIPISPEQAPDDRYLDEFVHIIKKCSLQQALVFNCGMGVSRTTFAMVTAMLIREFQGIGLFEKNDTESSPLKTSLASLTLLEENENRSRSLLRLVYILEKALYAQGYPDSAISWALQRTPLIEDMRNAVQGNYQFILQLLTLLKDGSHCKKLLDDAINKCDRMLNLREVIFKQRVQYSITGEGSYLEKAHGYLERYFFLLVFCSYLDENYVDNYEVTFENWIKARPEICRMMDYFRKKGPRLQFFRPIDDLSAFSGTLGGPTAVQGGRVVSELERSVVKSRAGTVLVSNTILKLDLWSKKLLTKGLIEGAGNFRVIPGMTIFGVAQPTMEGMSNVIKHVLKMDSSINEILWINLREEPLIYINSLPYVLRDQYLTLRNIKSFSGITPSRLEFLEERLKDDVIAETRNLEGRVLTHDETNEGDIVPSWQDVSPENIMTIKEIMEVMKMHEKRHGLQYVRVPITAETPPDESDFDLFIQILSSMSLEGTAVVL